MAFEAIKNKISNLVGEEILGETDLEIEQPLKDKKLKVKKVKKTKEKKVQNPTKQVRQPKEKIKKRKLFEKDEKEDIEEVKLSNTIKEDIQQKKDETKFVHNAVAGYEDVLSILAIKEKINIEVDFKSEDLDYIEFTQTTPWGFDFDEVTDFISRAKYTINKLETALLQRDRDVIIIASEVKKVEQKMIEKSQEKELERMMGGMTEEERLIEENMGLNVRVNELTRSQQSLLKENQSIEELKSRIEMLETENELLKLGSYEEDKGVTNKLPIMPTSSKQTNSDDDIFKDMLEGIGGLYDE